MTAPKSHAAADVGSTGNWERQALNPPSSAIASKPKPRSCCAARTLVASFGQVQ